MPDKFHQISQSELHVLREVIKIQPGQCPITDENQSSLQGMAATRIPFTVEEFSGGTNGGKCSPS